MSSAADGHERDDEPGLFSALASVLRLLLGWFSVAIGLMNLMVETDRAGGGPDVGYLAFHAVLVVGGLALLAVPQLGRNPGTPGYLTGGLVAAAGMLVATVKVTSSECCMTVFDVHQGWPFAVVARDTVPGDAGRWHLDGRLLVADLLFWAYAGLLALVVVALARRVAGAAVRARRDGSGPSPAAGRGGTGATHAEQRVYIEHGQNDTPAATSPEPSAPTGRPATRSRRADDT